jgi:hypothetical protein
LFFGVEKGSAIERTLAHLYVIGQYSAETRISVSASLEKNYREVNVMWQLKVAAK